MSDKYDVRWGTKEQPGTVQTDCRLKYYVSCTGLTLSAWGAAEDKYKAVEIEIFNSRNQVASGNIKIPHAKIPEVIEALNKFYYEGFSNG